MENDDPIMVCRVSPPDRRRRHGVAYIGATILVAIGMIVIGRAPAASAAESCSNSNSPNDHCYAISIASGPANYGGYGELYINCLYMPDNGYRVSNEIWDVSSSGTDWTEVGVISGTAYSGRYYSKEWYWADSRPSGGSYHEHEIGSTANTGTVYPVETTYVGDNTWDIYGGNSFTKIGVSTSQPESSSGSSEFGTEYTAPSGNGMRDIGTVYSNEWESSNGDWHSEGSLARAVEGGPGAYISPSYNSSSSYVDWSGPC